METDTETYEKDLQEFIRCILGNRLFEKQYTLYDQAVQFTLRGLSAAHGELIENLKRQKEILQDYPKMLSEAGIILRTRKINDTIFSNRADILTPSEIRAIYAKEFVEVFPQTTLNLLCKSLCSFIKLEKELEEEAFDPNF